MGKRGIYADRMEKLIGEKKLKISRKKNQAADVKVGQYANVHWLADT